MVDIQIVAGKRHDILTECLSRVLGQAEDIEHIYIANNTQKPIGIVHPLVTVVDNGIPLTFEQNHNRLAKLGKSEFILFLDDDAFIFPMAISTLSRKLEKSPQVLALGGINNQSVKTKYMGQRVLPIGSLSRFKQDEGMHAEIARDYYSRYKGRWMSKLFYAANFLLTRREVWERQYGGWDENYQNWNQEIDYILWGYERGFTTEITPAVWFYHCQSSSRKAGQLLENIVASSRHFHNKFPGVRLKNIENGLRRAGKKRVLQELADFIGSNELKRDRDYVLGHDYYQEMRSLLEP